MNERLADLLADIFGMKASSVHPDMKREDVGTWDSLKQMDMVMTLEREYEIAFDIPDILRMVSVAGIIEVLREKGIDLAA